MDFTLYWRHFVVRSELRTGLRYDILHLPNILLCSILGGRKKIYDKLILNIFENIFPKILKKRRYSVTYKEKFPLNRRNAGMFNILD
jgi:hypothetical protein